MLASTIQFTTNPPTPTPHHPHKAAEHRPGNQGALPQNPDSMPPPHTRAGAPTTTHQAAAGVSPTPHTTSQPHRTHPQHQPAMTSVRPTPTQPAQTHTAQTNKQPGRGNHAQLPILRKEVIQPHLPVRLPCYDFVPITSPTFDRSP